MGPGLAAGRARQGQPSTEPRSRGRWEGHASPRAPVQSHLPHRVPPRAAPHLAGAVLHQDPLPAQPLTQPGCCPGPAGSCGGQGGHRQGCDGHGSHPSPRVTLTHCSQQLSWAWLGVPADYGGAAPPPSSTGTTQPCTAPLCCSAGGGQDTVPPGDPVPRCATGRVTLGYPPGICGYPRPRSGSSAFRMLLPCCGAEPPPCGVPPTVSPPRCHPRPEKASQRWQ